MTRSIFFDRDSVSHRHSALKRGASRRRRACQQGLGAGRGGAKPPCRRGCCPTGPGPAGPGCSLFAGIRAEWTCSARPRQGRCQGLSLPLCERGRRPHEAPAVFNNCLYTIRRHNLLNNKQTRNKIFLGSRQSPAKIQNHSKLTNKSLGLVPYQHNVASSVDTFFRSFVSTAERLDVRMTLALVRILYGRQKCLLLKLTFNAIMKIKSSAFCKASALFIGSSDTPKGLFQP